MRYRGELLLHGREDFSLVELMIAIAIMSVILTGTYGVLASTQNTYAIGSAISSLNSQVGRTMNRITEELRDAGVATLFPLPAAPFGSSEITFQRNVGYQEGAIVWGDVIKIGLLDSDSNVLALWTDLGGANEQMSRLTSWVRDYAEGETANGADDNGNGLVDEKGFSFELNGNILTIRLTLERADEDGRVYTSSVDTSIRIRN